jgi:hypothetical protein
MANQLWRFTMTLVDDEDVKTSTSQYAEIPEATTGTNLQIALGAWATAVSAMSDGGVVKTEACLVADPSVFSLSPSPGGSEEVGEYGEFQWRLMGTGMFWTSGIPALSEGMVSGNQLDTSAAAVIAYTTLISSALLTTGFYCSPTGRQINARNATFLGTRKHRKQQHGKSYQLG